MIRNQPGLVRNLREGIKDLISLENKTPYCYNENNPCA